MKARNTAFSKDILRIAPPGMDVGPEHEHSLSKTTRRQEADGAASKQEVSKPSG